MRVFIRTEDSDSESSIFEETGAFLGLSGSDKITLTFTVTPVAVTAVRTSLLRVQSFIIGHRKLSLL